MQRHAIIHAFEQIRARVQLSSWSGVPGPVRSRLDGLLIEVRRDDAGEFFDIRLDSVLVDLEVQDVDRDRRHVLLKARRLNQVRAQQFLCGCQAEAWFVVAVPLQATVHSVQQALEVLDAPVPS